MRYRKWNKSKMKDQMIYLQNLFDDTHEDSVLLDMESLQSLMRRSVPLFELDTNFRNQLEEDINTLVDFEDFLDAINEFSEYFKMIDIHKFDGLSLLDLDPSLVLSFVHDFYNSVDREIAKIFNQVYKERRNNLIFSENRSFTSYLPNINYSYINLEKDNTVDEFTSAVHEFGHTVADRMYMRNDYFSKYPFIELMPIFMEMLAYDDLAASFNLDEELIISQAYGNKTILKYAKDLILFSKYVRKMDRIKRKKQTINEMSRVVNIKKCDASKILERSTLEKMSYTIPYLTSIELYSLYNLDPEKAIYILKNLVTLPVQENYEIALRDQGIILNEHTEEFERKLEKRIQTLKY